MAYDALMTEDSKHKLTISTLNAKVGVQYAQCVHVIIIIILDSTAHCAK